jgi:hypothetical protein
MQLHHGNLRRLPYLSAEREELAVEPRTSTHWSSACPSLHLFTDLKYGRLSENSPLAKSVILGASDTLKILLTATEDGKPKRPHQAFLLLTDQDTGLEATFPLSMKDSGKGKVDLVSCTTPVEFGLC